MAPSICGKVSVCGGYYSSEAHYIGVHSSHLYVLLQLGVLFAYARSVEDEIYIAYLFDQFQELLVGSIFANIYLGNCYLFIVSHYY